MLHFQALQFTDDQLSALSQKQMLDLAGNASPA